MKNVTVLEHRDRIHYLYSDDGINDYSVSTDPVSKTYTIEYNHHPVLGMLKPHSGILKYYKLEDYTNVTVKKFYEKR
jgi:hypothetical protein